MADETGNDDGHKPDAAHEDAVREAEAGLLNAEPTESADAAPSDAPSEPYDDPFPEPPTEGDFAMADNTAVNSQITDAVTQVNVKVLGDAPAMAMGALYQSAAHAAGILLENAVAQQQSSQTVHQAIVAAISTRLTEGRG
ncbi:RebB family R body protein [Pacificispira sp.]|uniref:RebB family R body protein n=1 Tax=Pacificispira sp. TaxID=2888761 RepID=UPI003B519D63